MFVQLQLLNFSSRNNALIINFDRGFWKKIGSSQNFWEVKSKILSIFKTIGKTKINEKLFGRPFSLVLY